MCGWTPRETTSYTYDDHGRVGGTITTRESEWDRAGLQMEIMLALIEVEKDVCPGCGGWLSITTVADHGHSVTSEQCFQCEAIGVYNEAKDKDDALLATVSDRAPRPEARRVMVQPIPLPTTEGTDGG